MYKFANPTRFMRISGALLPWAGTAAVIALAAGLYQGLLVAPADYQQGETVRIMFVHVPAAWTASFVYVVITLASIVSLVFRHPLADAAAKAAAPIGACFTFLALITGSLWGKPMWGAWWVWDARLTSVLILFLLYLGYIAIWQTIEEPHRAARIAAIVALVGCINIPIIKFSVDWWNSLHQPSSITLSIEENSLQVQSAIHPDILYPLLIMAAAYMLLFAFLHLVAMRAEVMRRRVRSLQLAQLEG